MSISLPNRVSLSSEVLFQELDSESILLTMKTEHYYSLDDIGTRMWQLLAEDGDTEKVVSRLLTEYEVDEAALRRDLAELIGNLVTAGLASVDG
jgi:hypothetical protein